MVDDTKTNLKLTAPAIPTLDTSHNSCHGVIFDSGVELDVDIHEERVKLSRGREKVLPNIAPSHLPLSEIEEEKNLTTTALRQWIVGHTKDITLQAACKYAAALYHYNIPSVSKLAKKITKDPSFLHQIGFDDDDNEEIMQALREEYPTVPAYSPTASATTTSSSVSSDTQALREFAATHSSGTTLQHLFQALHAQKADTTNDGKILATAVAALTGTDPIPSGGK